MLVHWCSTSGAPGVSGWSVFTGGMWPIASDRELVMVEADRAGGVMATRYGIGVSPGTAELVVAAGASELLDPAEFGRHVGERAWMVPNPVVPSEASAVWSGVNTKSVAMALETDDRVWFVDSGRFDPSSWVWHEAAVVTVVLIPAWTDSVVSAQPIVSELAATGRTKMLLVGKTTYAHDELVGFLGGEVEMLPRADVVKMSADVWSTTSWRQRGQLRSKAAELAAALCEFTTDAVRS